MRTGVRQVHTEDAPVLETLQQTPELLGNGGLVVEFYDSSIGPDDSVWGQYHKGRGNAEKDDN